jgi:hypothetical protein
MDKKILAKNIYYSILFGLALAFIFSMGYIVGVGKTTDKYDNRLRNIPRLDNYFADSSYLYLRTYRLSLPEELASLSWYNDKELDLLVGFIDDTGDIHLEFTGKTIPRDKYLDSTGRFDPITDHSEIPLEESGDLHSHTDYHYQ